MKVGIMVGRETSVPDSLIESINNSGSGVTAELVKLGQVHADGLSEYSVVVDRISHDVPYYRAAMKHAVLNGTTVLVNPFWFAADDKFFGTAMAHKLGVAIPKTVLLPQKAYSKDISPESLRNLSYPIDWQGLLDHVGLPAIMKPYDGGGWRGVNKIADIDELLYHYDRSEQEAMMVQEFIKWDRYVRYYVIGGEHVLGMGYDPAPYMQGKYFEIDDYVEPELHERLCRDSLTLTRALGYEINALEFAIRDGIPYAIDFMNPVCDAEISSVGEAHHKWFIEKVTDLCVKYAKNPPPAAGFHWSEMMGAPAGKPKLSASVKG